MPKPSKAEIKEFCDKLSAFKKTLSEQHQELLDAILHFAWNATAGEDYLPNGFDGCFEPDQADLMMKYKSGKSIGIRALMTPPTGIAGPHGIR